MCKTDSLNIKITHIENTWEAADIVADRGIDNVPISKKYKLDGVGPVDNRPSTDQLHHFVQIFEGLHFFLNVKKKYLDM